MQRSIARQLPLITSHIEFYPLKASGGHSLITPRIDFEDEWGPTDNTTVDPAMHMELDKNLEDKELTDDDHQDDGEELSIGNSNIPKPQGKPGRSNCGGYNIKSELHGWAPDLLENVTVSQVASTHSFC